MNSLTTAFSVSDGEGNTQPMIFQSILQYRGVRSRNAVTGWMGGLVEYYCPKAHRIERIMYVKDSDLIKMED